MLKKIIPVKKIRNFINLLLGVNYLYKNKKNNQIFDLIYLNKLWGTNLENRDGLCSGSGSHDPKIVKPYIKMISKYLVKIMPNSIVDLGCGDFNIGKNYLPLAKK